MRRRIAFYLGVPALMLLLAGAVVTWDFFGDQTVTVGGRPPDVAPVTAVGTNVYVEAELFSGPDEPDNVYLDLSRATFVTSGGDEPLCLHGIYVTPAREDGSFLFPPDRPYDGAYGEDELPAYRLDPPLCNFITDESGDVVATQRINADAIVGPDEPLELFLHQGERSVMFYPFDRVQGSWNLYALVLSPDGTLRPGIPTQVHVTSQLDEWEEDLTVSAERLRFETGPDTTAEWPAARLDVALSRTWTQRLLTLMLLVFLTVLIAGLLLVKDKQSLLELMTGILLGLWGIPAVLIPNYIQSSTLVHYWIILLYILLGLVTYVRFVGMPLVRGVDAGDVLDSLDDELEPLPEDEEAGERPV